MNNKNNKAPAFTSRIRELSNLCTHTKAAQFLSRSTGQFHRRKWQSHTTNRSWRMREAGIRSFACTGQTQPGLRKRFILHRSYAGRGSTRLQRGACLRCASCAREPGERKEKLLQVRTFKALPAYFFPRAC
jgi:hypothetical protein